MTRPSGGAAPGVAGGPGLPFGPDQALAALRRSGHRFEGDRWTEVVAGTPEDVAWNQVDLRHVDHVHGSFAVRPLWLQDRWMVGLLRQQLGPLRLPVLAVWAWSNPVHVRCAWAGAISVVLRATLEARGEDTEIAVDLQVGSWPGLGRLRRSMLRQIREHHARLRAEDGPLLARRRALRAAGFDFDPPRGYRSSCTLDPAVRAPPRTLAAPIVGPAGSALLGDAAGLRLTWSDRQLSVFARTCDHAGACLDDLEDGGRCPWHGRPHAPLARLDRTGGEAIARGWSLRLRDGQFRAGPA